jgi:hypothetical protein
VRLSYTIEQGTRAGLTGKDNWRKYPADMLAARCISRLAKRVYPDITQGCYVPDEEDDIRDSGNNGSQSSIIIDVSAIQGPSAQPPSEFDEKAQSLIDRINTMFVIEDVRSLVPEIKTLPREYQRRIKPVYDARIHAIETGEVTDPEPDPFSEQPPTEGPAQPDGTA